MKTCTVSVVSRSIWEPHLEQVFAGKSHEVTRIARVLLETMHNHHVGLTPELACELAVWLSEPEPTERKGLWRNVFERLSNPDGESAPMGMMPGMAPVYSVIRLAMPVVDEACKRAGLCYLYCEDEEPESPAPPQLKVYAESLHRFITAITRDEENDNFWYDRAFALADYARRPGSHAHTGSVLPETDMPALSMMRHLKPAVTQRFGAARHPKPLTSRQKHRETMRLKEGGIDGIRISRRMEDMGDMLLSEFINHPAILSDRLLNSGYMVHRRQPRREKLRDVLIAGVLPVSLSSLMAGFIKACWFDFIARMSWMLARNGLHRSEFRWLEADSAGHLRSQTFLLQDLPVRLPESVQPGPQWRRELCRGLGWLPPFLDRHARFEPLPQGRDTGLSAWITAAWRVQRESPRWTLHEQRKTKTPIKRFTEAFAHTHVMVITPASIDHKDVDLESLQRSFRLGKQAAPSVSLTHVPQSVTISADWAFTAGGRMGSQVGADEDGLDVHQLAGRLVGAWLEQLVKEIWRV